MRVFIVRQTYESLYICEQMPKKIILCVDDEKVFLKSLIGQLYNAFGRHVHEGFTSAKEAEEHQEVYAEDLNVDLIVQDWLMPKVCGDGFLIRLHKRFPDVKMIMLSAQASPEAIERAKKISCASYLNPGIRMSL